MLQLNEIPTLAANAILWESYKSKASVLFRGLGSGYVCPFNKEPYNIPEGMEYPVYPYVATQDEEEKH